MEKYPSVRSSMLEADEDALDGGFGGNNLLYRADINDPALANGSKTHAIFEFLYTFNNSKDINLKLAKSILYSENLPNECLGLTPLQLTKQKYGE